MPWLLERNPSRGTPEAVMRAYEFVFEASVTIHAENVAQARALSKTLRLIGARTGSRRHNHNRDAIRYSVAVSDERIARRRS